jgi:hypothetical protein
MTGADATPPGGQQDATRGAALELSAALDDLVDALAGSGEDRAFGADFVRRLAMVAAEMEHTALHRRSMDAQDLGDARREVEELLLGCARGGSARVIASRSRALAACRRSPFGGE